MADIDVLVVGAGPTGLVLALWLTRLGVRVRVLDRAEQAADTSRAVAVQSRTLELYRQLGLADAVVADGLPLRAANFWVRGRKIGRLPVGEIGAGATPFPYVLMYPQDTHERLLIARLSAAGVEVERRTELVGLDESGGEVRARLRGPDGDRTCAARFLAGCDGAHSAVREAIQVGFPGGTYSHLFYVADAEAAGPPVDGELHITFDDDDFLGVFPLKGQGRVRLIGTVHDRGTAPALTWQDVRQDSIRRVGIEVRAVRWFSTYRVHHRVAARFRRGPVFLLGDAAHIHSPVGGQGMNTGIGDAVNLAWKLAAVLGERAHPRLLDTFEAERIPFARQLVATTDRAFELATSPRRWARLARTQLVPRLVPALFRLGPLRRLMFRTVSQTAISYHGCALNTGRAGKVRGGDRLPWVPGPEGEDNHAPLATLAWQVHAYGAASPALSEACGRRRIPLHVFPWTATVERAGLVRDAVYLVRPDGYLSLVDAAADPGTLERHLDAWAVR
jgi:2-polyprenyl-6-methoxyphenol hydroxylase-like FAD-dependent oxidoreductase